MNAVAAVAGAALVVVGIAFVYWPAAPIAVGLLLVADAILDLRGDR